MRIRICDFETCGTEPSDPIVQVGQCDVLIGDGDRIAIGMPSNIFVNPGRPIPPDARGIHHICDHDVEGAPSPEIGLLQLGAGDPDMFCAHNAKYERQYFSGGDKRWICTRKIALRLWPDAPNHKNQTLRYFLNLDGSHDFNPALATPSHRAGPDCYVTAHLLRKAIEQSSDVDQLIKWSNEPSLLPGSINFGKHKGTPWPQVDSGYLEWLIRQPDMDTDTAFTAKHWLERRRCDAR